jgi:hypothetical protein
MKTQPLLYLGLIVILLAACAPESSATNPPAAVTEPPAAPLPTDILASPDSETATQAATEEATALPLATSRGPDLHATDPSSVSLASGGLQFVEFFRFT